MSEVITHPAWYQLDQGAHEIVRKIKIHGWCEPDYVVGLTRGGLIPAVRISHLMDIPMVAVNYSSVSGRGDNKNHQNALPAIYGRGIVSGEGKLPEMPTLLVVDDICDSGRTMQEVYDHYSKQGHRVWTAALYYKESAVMEPDFYWQRIGADAPWVIFPFENQ
jgi:hypoxanthine phosphoribosyltransferase